MTSKEHIGGARRIPCARADQIRDEAQARVFLENIPEFADDTPAKPWKASDCDVPVTMTGVSDLEALLQSLSCADLPPALPVTHATTAKWFADIAEAGRLEPRLCHVFNENLLYLFYGGIFYRTGKGPTQDPLATPVAFVFSPTVLDHADAHYPFDTGGMSSGRFGSWATRFSPLEAKCRLRGGSADAPAKLVCHLYKTNKEYLDGNPIADPRSPEPLASLREFLSTDLTALGADKRQCLIECHVSRHLTFDQSLMWVGFPESLFASFARIYEHTKPWLPDYYQYNHHRIYDPIEVSAQLEHQAHQVIRRFVAVPHA